MSIDTIHTSEIRRICENSENGAKHWFKPDNMRFFRSRVSDTAYVTGEYAYFVSSEQYSGSYKTEPRRYSVRRVNMKTGVLDTVGEFQEHATRAQALRALQLARAGWVPQ